MKAFLIASALAGALTPSHAAFAETDAPIVVTATRLPAPLDRTPAAITIIDADDLARRQTVFALDALATAPGVTIAQNGAFGGQASIRLRGAATDQTLVLIDGVPVNDATAPGGGFNVAFLDSAGLDRIEILRGPQSTLWGSDAIGGVVNIVTRAPSAGASGDAYAEAGSFGLVRTGGSLALGGAHMQARFSASMIGADGISKADSRDGNTEEDPYDGVTLDARWRLAASDALSLELIARSTESETQYDGFGFDTGVVDGDERDKSETRSGSAIVHYAAFGRRLHNTLSASRTTLVRDTFSNGVFSFGAEGARDVYRYQGDFDPIDALRLAIGVERERTSVEGSPSQAIDSFFALAHFTPIERLTLTYGARRDDHSAFGDVDTQHAGARFAVTDAIALRANWAEGFKAPTIFQLTSTFGALPPNTALRPETAEGWDAGVDFQTFGGMLSGEIGYFSLSTTDQIDFSFATFRYENIAAVETEGVEAAFTLTPTSNLTLQATYTYTNAQNVQTSTALLRVAEHAAYVEADWRANDRLGFTLMARYSGEEPDVVRALNPNGVNEDWTRFDLAARYQATPRVELYARVENIADEHYQDVFGYGEPGRAGYGGVRVRFE